MATMRLVPSTYYLSNSSYLSVSNASNMYTNTDSTTYATITNSRNQTSNYYIYLRGFNFDDIPTEAVVNSFTVKLKARESGVSTSDSYKPYFANGTSAINGTCSVITTSTQTLEFTGYSYDWDTIKGYGNNFGIRINCRRASRNTTGYMYIYGAEIEVNYTVPTSYTITASSADGECTVSPTSQIVYEGNNYTLKIFPNDENTAPSSVLDNNVEVVSQLVRKTNQPSYTVDTASGASYDFELNNSGYYESNNLGVANSTALSVVTFDLPVACDINFYVINYAESTYDFGLLGNLDETLSNEYSEDSSYKWSGYNDNSEYEQTITYSNVSAGTHEIYVKYFKDAYTSSNNDSLQFRIEITPLEQISGYYYEYTLSSVNANHNISVIYKNSIIIKTKVNGTWTEGTLKAKVNGEWRDASEVYLKNNGTWTKIK